MHARESNPHPIYILVRHLNHWVTKAFLDMEFIKLKYTLQVTWPLEPELQDFFWVQSKSRGWHPKSLWIPTPPLLYWCCAQGPGQGFLQWCESWYCSVVCWDHHKHCYQLAKRSFSLTKTIYQCHHQLFWLIIPNTRYESNPTKSVANYPCPNATFLNHSRMILKIISVGLGGLYHAPVIPARIWSFLWNPVESGGII